MKSTTLEYASRVSTGLVKLAEMIRTDTAESVATNDHVEVIKHYASVRQLTEAIKESREALDDMERQLSREYVPDVMRSHGVRTVTIEGVGRVSLSTRWSCSMIDKLLGMQWLRDTGNSGLIQETVNSNTLAAFAKDKSVNEGVELPSEIFKTSTMTITSITKA